MSLINQMLRDLESRRTGEQLDTSGISTAVGQAPRPTVPAWLSPLLLGLLLVTLLVIGWRLLLPTAVPPQTAALGEKVVAVSIAAPPPRQQATPMRDEIETAGVVAAAVPPSPPTSATPGNQTKPLIDPAPVAATPPVEPTPSRVQLHSLWPASLSVAPGLQDVMLHGAGFAPDDRVAIAWGGGGVLLDKRVVFLGPEQIRIRIRTGTNPDRWTIRVVSADGRESRALPLPISAADTMASAAPSGSGTEPAPQPMPLHEAPSAAGAGRAEPISEESERVEKRLRPLNRTDQAEQHYRDAYALLQQRQPEKAEVKLRQALGLVTGHRAAAEALTGLLVSQGRQVEALELLQQVRNELSGSATLAMLHARLLLERNQLGAAIGELERSAGSGLQPAEFYALLGGLYQRGDFFDDSIESYQRALQQQPRNAIWQMGLGISQEGAGNREAAAESLRQALASGRLSPQLSDYTRSRLKQLAAE